MASTFALAINDVAVPTNATDTLANVKSILEVAAPTNQGVRITGVDLSFDGVTATNKPVLVQVIRATAAATGAATGTITPEAENVDGNANSTILTTANLKYWTGGATGEGTVASVNGWRLYRIPPTAGTLYQLPLGRELWVPKAQFFRIRCVAVNAVNVTLNVTVEE